MTDFLYAGLVDMPWWGIAAVALGLTHITIVGVTVFLHRNQAHRSISLHPAVSHFFRFWMWLTTGMVTKEWSAIHRKHHAKVETEDDPHSPQVLGILTVLFGGAYLYRKESHNRETIDRYGYGAPDDWVERNIYTPYNYAGILLMAVINVALFGALPGALVWLTQMVWIPFWAAGVINGVGHYLGYRNFQTADESRNIIPLGLLIGGEELHNNHHAYPTSSKLSNKWFEFDLGWAYIRMLQYFGLAKIKRVAPILASGTNTFCDFDTLRAIIENRFDVLGRFAKGLRGPCAEALTEHSRNTGSVVLGRRALTKWLSLREHSLDASELEKLRKAISSSELLRRVDFLLRELASLWEDREANTEQLLKRMRSWCGKAEASGIEALQSFARDLRGFRTLRSTAT